MEKGETYLIKTSSDGIIREAEVLNVSPSGNFVKVIIYGHEEYPFWIETVKFLEWKAEKLGRNVTCERVSGGHKGK